MRRSGRGSGGGIGMNKHVERRAPKAEPRANRVREPAVAEIGGNYGDHVTNRGETGWRPGSLYGGRGYSTPVGPTDNVKAVGVGGGRTVMRSGQQAMTGQPAAGNPPPSGRDTLAEFGPESSRGR
jgi:hypothetical protein